MLEIKCLRSNCDFRRVNLVRNDKVRDRCGCKKSMVKRAKKGVLKWT